MVQANSNDGLTVIRSRAPASAAIVGMFAQSFPHHPISRLQPSLAGAFLSAFARSATLFVARDDANAEVGFLIGGDTATLDRTRAQFIRAHAWHIAAASTRDASLRRLLMPRLKPAKSFGSAPYAGHQLRFIAVASDARGLGVGSRLGSAFEETLPDVPGYHTWTMCGARGAEGFFSRLGFEPDITIGTHLRMWRRLG